MPQNPNQVLPALNPSNSPKPLEVDDNGALMVTGSEVSLVVATGTIAATGTIQEAIALNADRAPGGVIINHGTADMVGYMQAAKSATKGAGITIAAKGGTLYLQNVTGPNSIYTGAISISGTAADTYTTMEPVKP